MADTGPAHAPERLVVAAGLIWLGADPACLLVQRRSPEAAHGAGMLELPGGKLERGEGPRQALVRELAEEWGPFARELVVGRVAEVLHHVYPAPGPEVVLIVLHVDGRAWAGGRWRDRVVAEPGVELHEFAGAGLPCDEFLAADRPFVEALRAGQFPPPF
ncbi:NUDIX domain-containing protein [Nannocystaceae bacterium ST9]